MATMSEKVNVVIDQRLADDSNSDHIGEKDVFAKDVQLPSDSDPEDLGVGSVVPLSTAEDIVTHVIGLDDDPTVNPWTFRMFAIGKAMTSLNVEFILIL